MTDETQGPIDWHARALALEGENEFLKGQPRSGRPPKKARDAKSRMVRAACEKTGLSRKALAALPEIDVDPARLSPSQRFHAGDHDRLMETLHGLATGRLRPSSARGTADQEQG